jgi:hypothetical protein
MAKGSLLGSTLVALSDARLIGLFRLNAASPAGVMGA